MGFGSILHNRSYAKDCLVTPWLRLISNSSGPIRAVAYIISLESEPESPFEYIS